MVGADLNENAHQDRQWYEDTIEIRGHIFTLAQIKKAYQELQHLNSKKGAELVREFKRPPEVSAEDFDERNRNLLDDAFRVTVSIIGADGETVYGESESIFYSRNLPKYVKQIFLTNTTAYKRNAAGKDPLDGFSIYLDFSKPPLFDPNPLISQPTPNVSNATINAHDLAYFRAVQQVVAEKICKNRRWYSFLHEKFSYDFGLWLCFLPISIYWITVWAEALMPNGSKYYPYRIGFYIYSLGISLIIYRALFGYIKWAFPVNILSENKDLSHAHRVAVATIILGAVSSALYSFLGHATGLAN